MPASRLKKYRHFDRVLTAAEATELANDPVAVSQHPFYPLLLFEDVKRYFRRPGEQPKPPKLRPLRYAARSDAYIYMRYRDWLSCLYEEELKKRGLGDAVLAYRRIKSPTHAGNKCNVDFAYDAINHIRRLGDCHTVCLDIKSFFENLDHRRLKEVWASLLGESQLPLDHYQVFRSLTKYSEVPVKEVYRRLGFWGPKKLPGRPLVEGYLVDRRKIPIRLCDSEKMRQVVFGKNSDLSNIAVVRKVEYGIPQGTPIFDLLANIYMLDFDSDMQVLAASAGGVYMRYSDDILFIMPTASGNPLALCHTVGSTIRLHGEKLHISDGKTAIHQFSVADGKQSCTGMIAASDNKNFEYLGFRFDGRRIRIRDSTLSGLNQKIAGVVRREAISSVRRYRSKGPAEILALFDFGPINQRFGRVRDFEYVKEKSGWTFWTYVKKIEQVMQADAHPIMQQLKKQKAQIKERFASYVGQHHGQ